MHKHPQQTRDRIRQFIEFQLREVALRPVCQVPAEFLKGAHKDAESAARAKGWKPIAPGASWGPAYLEGWYRLEMPTDHKGNVLAYGTNLELKWESWGMVEGTIWLQNRPCGGLDFGHPYFRLPADAKEVYVQTYAHNLETTVHRPEKPRSDKPEDFKGFWLAEIDDDFLALFYDCEFNFDLMEALAEDDPAKEVLRRALNDVCNQFSATNRKTWNHCRRILKQASDSIACELRHTVYPVGHAHLDTAWLWPLAVTRLKMAHTTAVQLELAERYTEHVFAHSQASQYEWLEQEHPALLARVKAAARKGNWEPVGSMWVEADCNLTGGESLVRQFLYGRRYFKKHFGTTTHDMWLPDVFGYSAALPQILTQFGIKSFLTQKMSWNQTNKIPHNTFWWKGIDGSKIWTHFPPADTYCASCAPKEILQSVKNHRDKSRSDMSLYLHGFGDGGGGPTEWHLERLRRARLAPCLPHIESKVKASDFFERAMESSRDLETWSGELYFEFHRGTYTSQAANKASNRQCEFLLRDVEWLSAFQCDFPRDYPAAQIESLWKTVLLNQFHDIIPGSSVKEVYEDSSADYHQVVDSGTALAESAIRQLASHMETAGLAQPVAVFHNAEIQTEASFPWDERPVPKSIATHDERLPVQLVNDDNGKRLVFPVPMAARGTVAIADLSAQAPQASQRLKAANRRLESDELVVKFDNHGNITSIQTLDDQPIEFVEQGKLANLFQLLDDRPLFWDAWDTELYAQETVKDLQRSESFELVEKGPVRVAVELTKRFGNSTLRQRISIGPTPGIRFDTWVDWQEEHKFLKVAFPLNVNTQKATCEIQFGNVERATHRNTSWDIARFEVCAQKWVDLSEGGHGAALINTGKYGHDIHNNVLRLSLLRSPKAPDPTCDMGRHFFSYVLLPHFDQIQHSDVVAAAYAVNAKPWVVEVSGGQQGLKVLPQFVRVDDRNLVVESVKKAEDHAFRIVRLYECHNSRGTARLSCALPVKRAWKCDLNETQGQPLEIVDGSVQLEYKPFEILTVMLEL